MDVVDFSKVTIRFAYLDDQPRERPQEEEDSSSYVQTTPMIMRNNEPVRYNIRINRDKRHFLYYPQMIQLIHIGK